MRLNKFLAQATQLSRRTADKAIDQGRVTVNGKKASLGSKVSSSDAIKLDNVAVVDALAKRTVLFHKPKGYICSRDGQGGQTIYDILPTELHHLNPVGRLDKDSSGLLLLTNDGELANKLTHPRYSKKKIYEIKLNKSLPRHNKKQIEDGVLLDDGISTLKLSGEGKEWTVTMSEGRNRQIRRTFEAVGYRVVNLHRTHMGRYDLSDTAIGKFKEIL